MNIRYMAVMLTLGIAPLAVHAGVYSWKDADGKTHYGDRPPAARQADSRQLQAAPPADEAARKALTEQLMADREKQLKAGESDKKTEESQAAEQQRKVSCQQARTNLGAIESGKVRYTVGANGEPLALDGAARDAEIAKARRSVSEWCSPPKTDSKK